MNSKPQESSYPIPVLLIVFSRLDTTQQVFERIRAVRPRQLFVASDGPREHKAGESEKVQEVRDFILESVDWECEVQTLFQESNLGCKYNPQGAISWFFSSVEMGIVLEDDCVPSLSFFRYCQELLERYKDDTRIFGISGTNRIPEISIPRSYYFSEFFFTWGWASWSNRWALHEKNLENYHKYLDDPLLPKKLKNRVANKKLIERARISYDDKLDAWDYQWIVSCFMNNALIATPTVNLVRNIGFGEGSTHTSREKEIIVENEIEFPLDHPIIFHANQEADDFLFRKIFGWLTTWQKLTSIPYIKRFIASRLGR